MIRAFTPDCLRKDFSPSPHMYCMTHRSLCWKAHLFRTSECELAAKSESAGPGPSCAVETPLCHSLAATGVLMSDITINMGLIRAGQKPVSGMSLQSSHWQIMRRLPVTAVSYKMYLDTPLSLKTMICFGFIFGALINKASCSNRCGFQTNDVLKTTRTIIHLTYGTAY